MNYNGTQRSFIEAYKTTKYMVFNPAIQIEVGKVSDELNLLLNKYNASEWAFITAWNPYSRILSDQENEVRFSSLLNDIGIYAFYEGEGVGSDPKWLPEKSALIIGILFNDAIALGNKYEQNAIVVGKIGEPAKLVMLNAFEKVGQA